MGSEEAELPVRRRRARPAPWATASWGPAALLACAFGSGCAPCGNGPFSDPPHETLCGFECVDTDSDPNHCGGCFESCEEPEEAGRIAVCSQGNCHAEPLADVLVETTGTPATLAVDSTHVYWTTGCGGTVERVAKQGGAVEVIAPGQPGAWSVAVDDAYAYWTILCDPWPWGAEPACCVPGAAVARTPLAGGAVEVLAPVGASDALMLALDADNVYWSTRADGVWKVPKTGGTPVALVPAGAFVSLAFSGGGLYAAGFVGSPPDENHLYRDIFQVPTDGAPATMLTSGLGALDLDVDGSWLYWLDCTGANPALARMPLAGGSSEVFELFTNIACGENLLRPQQWLAVDGDFAYFDTAGDVRKTPKTGGATIDVPQPYYPIDHGGAVRTAFAVDETSVYYTTGHSVRRAPK